jgi:CelD/BcsL family acetyltransferase involved in cellulose biosynthesis
MRISIIHPSDLGSADIDTWHEMQRCTPSLASPFLSPEFVMIAGRFWPDARIAVLTDGLSTTGFFPYERRKLGVGVPIAAGLTDCQGLIHAPGLEWDAKELLRACQVCVWKFDHLVEGQTPFGSYLDSVRPSPIVDLTHGFESYFQEFELKSRRLCKALARNSRKLSREVGELRFVLDSRDVSSLRTLMAWKSAQYRRTGVIDLFAQTRIVRLVDALFAADSNYFNGMLSVLYAGDVPVAAHFGIRCLNVLANWFPAYDVAFRRYSPGLILHLHMAQAAASDGIGQIDMGAGAKHYKNQLKSSDLFVGKGVVTTRSPLASVHIARWTVNRWAMQTIKQHPELFEVAHRLRSRYRQTRARVGQSREQ